jgi:rhodanese-related sulfurtransferase
MKYKLLLTIAISGFSLVVAGNNAENNEKNEAAQNVEHKDKEHHSADHKNKKSHEHHNAKKSDAPVKLTEVSTDDVQKAIDDKSATLVLAIEGKGIEGSIRVLANADDKTIHAALPNKDAKIITYCGSGSCPASVTLAERLVGLGYKNVEHYAGGLKEWEEKYPESIKEIA